MKQIAYSMYIMQKGIKLPLQVGFGHLKEHKFRQDAINPPPSCGNFVESSHFSLHCSYLFNQRLTLMNKINGIDKPIFEKNDSLINQTLLFGDKKFSIRENKFFNI